MLADTYNNISNPKEEYLFLYHIRLPILRFRVQGLRVKCFRLGGLEVSRLSVCTASLHLFDAIGKCGYMRACIHTSTVYIYIYTHTHASCRCHIRTYTYIRLCFYTCVYIYICMSTHYVHACMHTYIHTYIQHTTCMHAYIQ